MTYLESLEDAWQDHLAPRDSDAPTVVSTFAGCGGSSLGYSMAGFRELLAVEWDQNAVDTFRLNFPEVPVYHGDIGALSVEEALRLTGLVPGALDVLDGSPPCQGFSTAGKRNLDDDRNQLFREFCRLLAGLQPRAFVMENVSGMVKGKMRLVFVEILRELKACGYRVSARLLNAMYFGVPQSRQRLIFVGVRDDLDGGPTVPAPTTRPHTLRYALTPPPDAKHDGDNVSPLRAHRWLDTPRGGAHKERFSLKRLSWSRPSNALIKVSGSGGLMHPDEPRLLNTGECQRVGSFPDAFEFVGSWSDSVARIGNSVPPLFMRAIAQHVRETILTPELSLAP